MKGTLITFADVRERQEIDIVGGYIEVDLQHLVHRGKVEHITWWNNYPREIFWTNNQELIPPQYIWKSDGTLDKCMRFGFNSVELFFGPCEFDSGELFFILQNSIAVTLFPRGITPPNRLESQQHYQILRCQFPSVSRL